MSNTVLWAVPVMIIHRAAGSCSPDSGPRWLLLGTDGDPDQSVVYSYSHPDAIFFKHCSNCIRHWNIAVTKIVEMKWKTWWEERREDHVHTHTHIIFWLNYFNLFVNNAAESNRMLSLTK